MEDFILKAYLGCIGIVLVAGALGCFVVWRRMAYFGDSLAHSALLGVAFGVVFKVGFNIGVVMACMLFAFLIVWLRRKKVLAMDTLLGFLAHAALSIGVVWVGLVQAIEIDLESVLFGEIYTTEWGDIIWIYAGGAVAFSVLCYLWRSLLLVTLNSDLAQAEGVNVLRIDLIFMVLMSVVVAIAIQIVGVLLITSLLIIPAATSRQWARSPEAMAIFATIIGVASVTGGMAGAIEYDLPPGPSIVVAATGLFIIMSLAAWGWNSLQNRR